MRQSVHFVLRFEAQADGPRLSLENLHSRELITFETLEALMTFLENTVINTDDGAATSDEFT